MVSAWVGTLLASLREGEARPHESSHATAVSAWGWGEIRSHFPLDPNETVGQLSVGVRPPMQPGAVRMICMPGIRSQRQTAGLLRMKQRGKAQPGPPTPRSEASNAPSVQIKRR